MNNVHTMSEIITTLFDSISTDHLKSANATQNVWKKVLFSMDEHWKKKRFSAVDDDPQSRRGENLFYHSKIVDKKNGALIIEVDHPGWIQLFQLSQNYILRGLKKFAPDLNITALSFKLRGQS